MSNCGRLYLKEFHFQNSLPPRRQHHTSVVVPPPAWVQSARRGTEAAFHPSRVYLNHLTRNKAILRVNFQNAFNSTCRGKVLATVQKFIPDLLSYVLSAYSSPSSLMWDNAQLKSAEGVQKGDPLDPMLFCLGIHDLVASLSYEFRVF